jgi:hypothetical protein
MGPTDSAPFPYTYRRKYTQLRNFAKQNLFKNGLNLKVYLTEKSLVYNHTV